MINYIFASLFFAKTFSKLIADYVIDFIPYTRFILTDIATVSDELSKGKVYDLVEWGLFFGLAILIFIVTRLGFRLFTSGDNKHQEIFGYFYLLVSLMTFLYSHFSVHSSKVIIIFTLVFNLFFWIAVKRLQSSGHLPKFNFRALYNGFLLGFLMVLIIDRATTLNLFVLAGFSLTYLIFSERFSKFINSNFHLLFSLGIVFYSSRAALLMILLVGLALIITRKNISLKQGAVNYLYLFSAVALIVYNPLFYIGKFDTVEEGFWLGWLQRMINGKFIYKDFYAYHPPFLLWGLFAFTKLTSISIYYSRLYFHLLQVLGLATISAVSFKLIKNRIFLSILLLLIFSITGGEVRNNVEIRLGLGILSLFILHKNLFKGHHRNIIFSGIFAAISFFASIEVGISSIGAGLVYIFLRSRDKLKFIFFYLAGLFAVALPVFFGLASNHALSSYLAQISEYSSLFSRGYFNIIVERPSELSFFYWHIFYEYLGQTSFYWFLVQISFGFTLLWFFNSKLVIKKNSSRLNFVVVLTVFGLFLSRSSLGRSDYYHMLYILVLSLIIFFYLIDSVFSKHYKGFVTAAIFVFIFVIMGGHLKYYISSQLYKFQTYGRAIGNYQTYESDRYGILVEEDSQFVREKDELIKYIKDNTDTNDEIFSFPWIPELYFLTDRKNATSFDTPYAFILRQEEMLDELKVKAPKIVVYNPNFNIGNFNVGSMQTVNSYINSEYSEVKWFGSNILMVKKGEEPNSVNKP